MKNLYNLKLAVITEHLDRHTILSSTDIEAGAEYYRRQVRQSHPDCDFDDAGRAYLSKARDEYCDFCDNIRSPSRRFPYSEMTHGRSAVHVASLYDADEVIVRKIGGLLKKILDPDFGLDQLQAELSIDGSDVSLSAVRTTAEKTAGAVGIRAIRNATDAVASQRRIVNRALRPLAPIFAEARRWSKSQKLFTNVA